MANYEFNLLNESVSSEDLFDDKTHEKIAQSLSDLILTKDKGITIGLEGSWGSGKSSIISMIFNKIKEANAPICTFQFDAWAHEGDKLRKIFLVSFINALVSQIDQKNHINSKKRMCVIEKLNEKKKIINNQIITKTIHRKRSITKKGIVFSVFALFVPFGAAALSNINLTQISSNPVIFALGLTAVFAPFPVILINIIRVCLKKTKLKDIFAAKNWMFLQNDDSEVEEKEFSEMDERTSIEFENYFFEILDCVFDCTAIKKIVLVIDNLDRIEKSNALSMWSTLQIFLQERNETDSTKNENFNKVWILVPFDSSGLQKIWNRNAGNNIDKSSIDGNSISKSFIDKSFQLRIDVPKPLFSEWEKFTKLLIKEAIHSWPENEQNILVDVLRVTRKTMMDIPTPREIKNYINQTAFLASIWGGTISISSIAYYVIWRELENQSTDQICKHLRNDELIDKIDKDVKTVSIHKGFLSDNALSNNAMAELAGLAFGVEPKKGYEMLLLPEIEAALENEKIDELKDSVEKHPEGFWTVFNQHILVGKLSSGTLLTYSYAVTEVFKKHEEQRQKLEPFIKKLNEKNIIPVVINDFFSSTEFKYYTAYHNLVDNEDFVQESLKHFNELLNKFFSEQNEESDEEWTHDIIPKYKLLIDHTEYRKLNFEPMEFNFDTHQFIAWANYLHKNDLEDIGKYFIITDECFAELNQSMTTVDNFSEIYDPYKYIIRYHLKEYKWDAFVANLPEYLSRTASLNNIHVLWIFELLPLSILSGSTLEDLRDGWELFNAFQYVKTDYDYIIAIIAGKLLKENLQTHQIPNSNYSSAGLQRVQDIWMTSDPSILKSIIDRLENTDNLEFIWKLIEDDENTLAYDIIASISENDDTNKLKQNLFASKKSEIISALIHLFKKLNHGQLVQITQSFIKNDNSIHDEFNFIDDIFQYSQELCLYVESMVELEEEVHTILTTKLKSVKKDDWRKALDENDSLLNVITLIHKNQKFSLTTGNYIDALQDHSDDFIHNVESDVKLDGEGWKDLVSILTSSKKDAFTRHVNSFLKNKLREINVLYIKLNKEFIDWNKIFKSYNEIIDIVVDWHSNGKNEVVEYFIENIANNALLGKKLSTSERRSLKKRVDGIEDDDQKGIMQRLLEKLTGKNQ